VLLHCCGAIAPLIPEFIECGIDALNPAQISAANMGPAMLKREFGKDIVFWGGGIRTQTTLFHGGYIFTVEHDIQEYVPPEKIMAVFETAQHYRDY
jgi:uroporphyrinogen decarboxylase